MYATYLTVTFDGYISLRRCWCYVTWRAVPYLISIILIIFIVWTDYLITVWIILTVIHNNQRCIYNMGFIHNVELKSVNGREKRLHRRVSTCGYQSKHSDFVTHVSGMSNGRYLSLSAQIPNWGGVWVEPLTPLDWESEHLETTVTCTWMIPMQSVSVGRQRWKRMQICTRLRLQTVDYDLVLDRE